MFEPIDGSAFDIIGVDAQRSTRRDSGGKHIKNRDRSKTILRLMRRLNDLATRCLSLPEQHETSSRQSFRRASNWTSLPRKPSWSTLLTRYRFIQVSVRWKTPITLGADC